MTPLAPVGVIGAGTMGAGIAQLAITAGHTVYFFDARDGAVLAATQRIEQQLESRVAAGKLSLTDHRETLSRLMPVSELGQVASCELIIEAIIESLGAKQELFADLEDHVPASVILASNTSSLSISAIAKKLRFPGRVVGMHFFNPVHSMKLVEIVSGLDTEANNAQQVFALAQSWGKSAVFAKSTPGYIVNRIARPYYAEALMLIQEQSATPAQIDELSRSARFKMGPCELMDLIGHDVNLAVTESMFRAFYEDRRFTPSIVQRELVDAGRFGRKTSRGFYTYPETRSPTSPGAVERSALPPAARVTGVVVRGTTAAAREWAVRLSRSGFTSTVQSAGHAAIDVSFDDGRLLALNQTLGITAAQLGAGRPSGLQAVTDLPLFGSQSGCLSIAYHDRVDAELRAAIATLFDHAGVTLIEIADTPGLLVARTIAMLVNEAADAVQQGVCTCEEANVAMKLGVNYPAGPFEWLDALGVGWVVSILQNLGEYYKGERYRVSPWLQNRRWHESH